MSAQAPTPPAPPAPPTAQVDPPNPAPIPTLADRGSANAAIDARLTHLGAEVAGLRDAVQSLGQSQGTALSAGAMVGAAILVAFLAILIVDRRVAKLAKSTAEVTS